MYLLLILFRLKITEAEVSEFEGYDSDKDREYIPTTSDSDSDENEINGAETVNEKEESLDKIKTRKRQRNPSSWKCNKRKTARDAGKEYISIRNKLVPAKHIKNVKDCINKCLYKCQKFITEEERNSSFKHYYTLTEHTKRLFLLSTTIRYCVARHRKDKNESNSRRKQTYQYYFQVGNNKIQVCKQFYLSTLNISQTPIYTAHSKKDDISNILKLPNQGRHLKHKISDEDRNFIRMHIESFPKIESHYCRANSDRLYLEPCLSITKMYSLYLEACTSSGRQPNKESCYRFIFDNNYNLHFHVPKKDRCDLCEEVKLKEKEKTLTDEKKEEYDNHVKEKEATRNEKRKDRENNSTALLVFDLQNVLSCPQADISNFYYKSKLNVYNLTAILSTTKQVYCAIWHEILMGRVGNDLASAVIRILKTVFEDNDLTKLVL